MPLLGKSFVNVIPEVNPAETSPLYCWYADIYYLRRSKFIIICNEISRFTWIIGPYSANAKVNFMEVFHRELNALMERTINNPEKYMDQLSGFGRISETHRGAVAHINRLKSELDYLKMYFPHVENREFELPHEFWRVRDTITSRNGEKGFFSAEKRFVELWEAQNTPESRPKME